MYKKVIKCFILYYQITLKCWIYTCLRFSAHQYPIACERLDQKYFHGFYQNNFAWLNNFLRFPNNFEIGINSSSFQKKLPFLKQYSGSMPAFLQYFGPLVQGGIVVCMF